MGSSGKDLGQELSDQVKDIFSRLESKQLFQSEWDIAAFAIFFTFIGMIFLLVLLVLIRCCCCCCCDCDSPGSYNKVCEDPEVAPCKTGTEFIKKGCCCCCCLRCCCE